MLKFQINDIDAQRVLGKLVAAGQNLTPLMKSIGEGLADSTKDRFQTSTAPDGSRWQQNAASTIVGYLSDFPGSFGKSGRLNKRGAARVLSKKPLIGISKELSTTINYKANATGVEIGSPLIKASTHQSGRDPIGGFRARIPARPFLGLSQGDQDLISDSTLDYLESLVS